MKINIQSIAFTLRKEASDFIKNKVKKLTRFYSEIISIEVSLKIDKSNFYRAGWFKFELYEDGKLMGKNKFYLEKDF